MCFSAEASFGVAAALLPVGGYCIAAGLARNRSYLPLSAVPLLFGVQQLFEGVVWVGVGRDPALANPASVGFLFFALLFWPAWVPLAAAALEPPGTRRRVFLGLAAAGLAVGAAYFLPVAAGGAEARAIGHSLRYDLPDLGWAGPALYLAAVAVPLATSRDRLLRPLGAAVALAAAASSVLFEHAAASVWCFFAAVFTPYLAYVLLRLPKIPDPIVPPAYP